ncbi:MAG: hypothetical protein AAGE52_01235 [Myxococcota bacterium]
MTYTIRYRRAEAWRGHRWIVTSVDGRTLAKGWVRPDGTVDHDMGECPPGATQEIAARFGRPETASDEEE